MTPLRASLLSAAIAMGASAAAAAGSDWPVDRLDEWFALKVGVTRENDPAAGTKYAGRLSTDVGLTLLTVVGGQVVYHGPDFEGAT